MAATQRLFRRKWSAESASPTVVVNLDTRSAHPERTQQQQQQPPDCRESNLSRQRRERGTWATCLQKVQGLRRGGLWQSLSASNQSSTVDTSASRNAAGGRDQEIGGVDGYGMWDEDVRAGREMELVAQLDVLATLTYPNSSISPQDAGFLIAAFCEAVPLSPDKLCARVAQLYISLCAKQQKVAFLAWQLDIVLDFFLALLVPELQMANEPASRLENQSQPQALPPSQREYVRALAQMMYENGERLGTRFGDILPPLLYLADPAAADMEVRHAALDTLANLCLKNWAGFTALQRAEVCSCLTRNFDAHWRAFGSTSSSSSYCPIDSAAQPITPGAAGAVSSASRAALLSAEHKVLASATRGLACSVGKAGVSAVLEPYLSRVIHALNHLVQPAGRGERVALAAAASRSSGGRAGVSSNSGSQSRSRGRGFGQGGDGDGALPSSTTGSRSALPNPRARVRLQALALLEAIAAKDAKALYPHWALFFGGQGAQAEEGHGAPHVESSVLPPGLVTIMESDEAPQIRAAAAAAATSLVKNAPLRMWIPLAPRTTAVSLGRGGGGGGWGGGRVEGIGQRVTSMMHQLQTSLVACLAREKSAAVVAKLCSCAGALVSDLPHDVVPMVVGGNDRGRGGSDFEGLLAALLATLATLMLDVSAEPSSRIAASQAMTAAFSTKEPLVAIDLFLRDFRSDLASRGRGGLPSRDSSAPTTLISGTRATTAVIDARLGPPIPPQAGGADDRSNRFSGRINARRPSPFVRSRGATTAAAERTDTSVVSTAAGAGVRAESWRRSSSKQHNVDGGDKDGGVGTNPILITPPPPSPRMEDFETDSHHPRHDGNGGFCFVDSMLAVANAAGQLRAEALGLLTRIGRSYPSHLSGEPSSARGGGENNNGNGGEPCPTSERKREEKSGSPVSQQNVREDRWDRASRLLLRCFADPDQNLRLHALKVLEALLLARAERAAALTTAAEAPAGSLAKYDAHATGRAVRASTSLSPSTLNNRDATRSDAERTLASEASFSASESGVLTQGEVDRGGGRGGGLWGDLVQKHLQRALDDPYHGVRAVACSCHGCLLESDWEAFSDRERDRCLNRLLAATRDRAAGVNVLACRVVAGLMTMAGNPDASNWCREPGFLGRCAARLEEMMEDPKAAIRSQTVLAVGNLSCSLHSIRLRSAAMLRHGTVTSAAGTPSPTRHYRTTPDDENRTDCVLRETSLECGPELVKRSQLRSLCEGALRLTTNEPDHAAGSAARALGYLAWSLDVGATGGNEEKGYSLLQGKAVFTLATRANAGGEEIRSANDGIKDGGEVVADGLGTDRRGARGVRDRRADIAAAKCRWNCCIAVGLLLSAPGLQARVPHAPWAGIVVSSLRRAMMEDEHLKVRIHAAIALKAFPNTLAYGGELPVVFGGALRSLQACKEGIVASDPTQLRYAGSLEAAFRALVLHIFLLLVFDTREDQNTEDAQSGNNDERDSSPAPSLTTEDDRLCPPFSSKSEAVGVGDGATGCAQKTGDGNLIGSSTDGQGVVASAMDRATLLGEHANVLLEVVSAPESDSALTPPALLSYCVSHGSTMGEKTPTTLKDRSSHHGYGLTAVAAGSTTFNGSGGVTALEVADVVLGAAAEKLVHLLSGSRLRLVANQTLQSWVSEASRRRARRVSESVLWVGEEATVELTDGDDRGSWGGLNGLGAGEDDGEM